MAGLRPRAMSTLSALAGIGAVVATLAFANDVAEKSLTASPPSSSVAAGSVSPYPRDDHGFANSFARCEGALSGVAFARTEGSLVAICTDATGNYRYRGVRLADGAVLDLAAENTGAREFMARNNGVTYELSANELVITAGNAVVRREPVLDYPPGH